MAALLLLPMAAACGEDSDWRNPALTLAAESKAEAAYLAPPAVTGVLSTPGVITVQGSATRGARVRLGPPAGEPLFADTDAKGDWRVALPNSGEVQLYGLSMILAGRTVQSEGYVAVLPGGQVVRLRAGAGSVPLTKGVSRLRILAVDYDRDGGAMVSGRANPGASLVLRIDGVEAQGAAGPDGRFSIAASEPLMPGSHQIVVGGDGEHRLVVEAAAVPALTSSPMRAQRTAQGWRIDWMTPGGGVQSTLIPAV